MSDRDAALRRLRDAALRRLRDALVLTRAAIDDLDATCASRAAMEDAWAARVALGMTIDRLEGETT